MIKKSVLSTLFFFIIIATYAQQPEVARSESVASITWADKLWVLISAGFVFLMQAGFKCLEVGMVRERHIVSVALKNIIDWSTASILFFLVGFGLMFGSSFEGIVGTSQFFFTSLEGGNQLGFFFFLFQLAFVGTSLTIVSGAMSERTGFVPYIVASILISAVVYPVFGHWAWGSLFFSTNAGWLEGIGFVDFAGSTVVHSLGAWISLAGLVLLGPRIGRYQKDGTPRNFRHYNVPYAILGVFLLWIGWWGFNGGSTLAFTDDVAFIILNTNLAGVSAVFAAYIHCKVFQEGDALYDKLIGGVLGGLVAITASPHIQSPFGAIFIGLLAGVVHNWAFDFIIKKKIDDAVGAIPVHGACGALGTLLVILAPEYLFGAAGFTPLVAIKQLGIQAVGVVMCFIWAFSLGYIVFKICKMTVGLRVSPEQERKGVSLFAVQETADDDEIDEEEVRSLLKDMEI